MKILSIVGARPQFVKAAAVSRAILEYPQLEESIVHTGQHFDAGMSDIFFRELEIPKPSTCLNIHGGTHGEMTGRMLIELDRLLVERRPDCVLVYGDTNSTLAGALSAAKLHMPVAHVEAGLRSFNMSMPEEINRILTDQISRYLFCPTEEAMANLLQEGFERRGVSVVKTGDVMLDAAQLFQPLARAPHADLPDRFVLATIHRAENTDDPQRLAEIVAGLNAVHGELMPVVLPLHPRTRGAIARQGLSLQCTTLEPVGYLQMLWLLERCSMVATDSGGLQKEAYFFGKPCVTVRDQTEWVELVELGANLLTPPDRRSVVDNAREALSLDIQPDLTIYGGGASARSIAQFLAREADERNA